MDMMLRRGRSGKGAVPWCHINSGAAIVRNTAESRAMIKWWAYSHGKACPIGRLGVGAPEQACAQRMKAAWPAAVDVVSARLFNMPAWVDSSILLRGPQAYVEARAAANSTDQLACFRDPAIFVCHLWNAMRRPRAEINALRRAAFADSLNRSRALLTQLVAARGERYVSIAKLSREVRCRSMISSQRRLNPWCAGA